MEKTKLFEEKKSTEENDENTFDETLIFSRFVSFALHIFWPTVPIIGLIDDISFKIHRA